MTAYNTAFEELREKGFLVVAENDKNKFTFYEMPK